MGAFAGSSAVLCREPSRALRVLTVTINNHCNLSCPHCYLQYDSASAVMHADIPAALCASAAPHVSIVGMEPLVNRASVQTLADLIGRLCDAGKEVSFITNGLNAHLLPVEAARRLAWIDISVDGSERSYKKFRGASFAKLLRGVEVFRDKGVASIRILQTLHRSAVSEMAAVLSVGAKLGADLTIVSPFVLTEHQGRQADLSLRAEEVLSALEGVDQRALTKAWFVSDAAWLNCGSVSPSAETRLNRLFGDRTVLFKSDPLRYGMVRLTYEGQLLTPAEAMHTRRYRGSGANITEISIDDYFASHVYSAAA